MPAEAGYGAPRVLGDSSRAEIAEFVEFARHTFR